MCLCVSRESVRRSTTVMRYPSELLQGLAVLCRALRQNAVVKRLPRSPEPMHSLPLLALLSA